MDKKRILLLGAMGILLAAAIALGAVWIMEAAEYAGYKADYVDIAEDVLHSDEDDGMIELVPLSPAPKQNDTLDDPTASAATDPRSTAEPSRPASASNADGKEAAQRVSVDFAALAAQNSDTVGWLYIPGTKINYPVVQADDNEYYLRCKFQSDPNGSAQYPSFVSVNRLTRRLALFYSPKAKGDNHYDAATGNGCGHIQRIWRRSSVLFFRRRAHDQLQDRLQGI